MDHIRLQMYGLRLRLRAERLERDSGSPTRVLSYRLACVKSADMPATVVFERAAQVETRSAPTSLYPMP